MSSLVKVDIVFLSRYCIRKPQNNFIAVGFLSITFLTPHPRALSKKVLKLLFDFFLEEKTPINLNRGEIILLIRYDEEVI